MFHTTQSQYRTTSTLISCGWVSLLFNPNCATCRCTPRNVAQAWSGADRHVLRAIISPSIILLPKSQYRSRKVHRWYTGGVFATGPLCGYCSSPRSRSPSSRSYKGSMGRRGRTADLAAFGFAFHPTAAGSSSVYQLPHGVHFFPTRVHAGRHSGSRSYRDAS